LTNTALDRALARIASPDFGKTPIVREQSSGPWSKELIRAIAMDIGKAVVHHIETMYPAAIKACPSTFKLSVRNSVHNEIMAAIEITDEGQIIARLKERKQHRRKIKSFYTKIRKSDRT